MALEYFHEPREKLPEELINQHRAIGSLIEELEAASWYTERHAVSQDPELKAILEHNRDEEYEHAAMLIEWLRRNVPSFAEQIDTYLKTTLPITEIEELAESENENNNKDNPGDSSLSIGSLK